MHIQQANIQAWSRKWVLLKAFLAASLCVSIAATIGSVVSLSDDVVDYHIFDHTRNYNMTL